jgi:hypothetical protein
MGAAGRGAPYPPRKGKDNRGEGQAGETKGVTGEAGFTPAV